MHSIHPSNDGGFTWVICRLTIHEDVMCDYPGLSLQQRNKDACIMAMYEIYADVGTPWLKTSDEN